MFRYDCSAIWMKTCNESRRFTCVCYFFTSGGILHDKIADFLIKEQCSPKSSWNISAKHQESWWQLYKGMLWVFKLKKRPCARQKRREPYRILHSVLSIYEIYWNRLRSWFLAIFQSFHLVHSMTPSIHLLCSGSFKQIPICSLRASVPRYYQTQFDWDGHLSLRLFSRSCFSAANVAPQSCKNSGKIWIFARRPLKKQLRRLGPNCRVCIGK